MSRQFQICGTILLLLFVKSYPITFSSAPIAVELAISPHKLKNNHTGTVAITTSGLYVTFPTVSTPFSIRFGSEYGMLKETRQTKKTSVLLSQIALSCPVQLKERCFFIIPELSVANCAIHIKPTGTINDAILIATWENEFGAGTGCSLMFQFKWLTVATPLSLRVIFSSNPAYIISTGVMIGFIGKPFQSGKQ